MTAMTCKLSGLFSLDEDFDDEDVLGTDWSDCSVPGSANVTAAVSSCSLRASSVALREQEKMCHQPVGEKLAGLCNGAVSRSAAQTVSLGLRQISSSSSPASLVSTVNNSKPQQSPADSEGPMNPCTAQDDFDDWDLDLADLDECDDPTKKLPKPAAPAAALEPPSSGKTLRPSTYVTTQTPPNKSLRELSATSKSSNYYGYNATPQSFSTPHRQSPRAFPAFPAAPLHTPTLSPATSSFSRTPGHPHHLQTLRATAQTSSQAPSLFTSVPPAPAASANPSAPSPHPLHTPVLTNRLVQLVSASSKLPRKRPCPEARQPSTRRFPGPAGLLPQQPQGQNLDEIVVSVPHTPAHGAVARLPIQCSSSQSEEDEFNGGAWAAMKAEMGLDERNLSCFLHTYSAVMVLRKAALKQLPRNKVPNMAVLLKSIIHTNTDAKAVFKDPTGEIQGTVHRRLLEDRSEELKAGAVLLLKQVGVFSPSHRNHYLNVTPNNLLRIYSPDGVSLSAQLPPIVLEPMMSSPARALDVPRGPVSRMQLEFDEDDDVEGKKDAEGCRVGGDDPRVQILTKENKSVNSSRGLQESFGNPAPQGADWDAEDDLDELLGEISEDTYSF